MGWTFVALVMTVLMGGFIAYNGDLIGRRFGKKRVTMFGLRPRYTAILITSVTGVAISAITTGVLFLLVPSVRDVILRGEKALAENIVLTSETKTTKAELGAEQKKVSDLKHATEQQNIKYEQAAAKAASVTSELHAKEATLKNTEASLAASKASLEQVRAESKKLVADNRRLASSNQTLADKNSTLAKGNTALASQNGDLARENATLTADNEKKKLDNAALLEEANGLAQRNITLTNEIKTLERVKDVLARTADALRNTTNTLKQDNDIALKENNQLKASNVFLSNENRALLEVVKRFSPDYKSIMDAYRAARNKRVAVHKDEDLARIVIPANTDPSGVRSDLQTLLRDSSDAAKLRGASAGQGLRAVQVMDREFASRLPNGQVETVQVTGNDRIDGLVAKLAWQTTPSTVLAIAVANTVEDEPAAIDLQPFPNRRVYTKGQVVQWRYFNGQQPQTDIYEAVVSFLKDLGKYSLEHGVIPRMDPLTGEPAVGAMSFPDILNLMKRIEEVGGRVRVRAIAEQDIFSADPLKMKFDVTQ